jgi:hypothetical protein
METFIDFVKERAKKTNRRDANCTGTALYLVGELESDVYLNRQKSSEKLSMLKESPFPENGYLVYWGTQENPIHVGIIFDKDFSTIIHRKNKNDILKTDSLEELSKDFGKPKYKIPSKFN